MRAEQIVDYIVEGLDRKTTAFRIIQYALRGISGARDISVVDLDQSHADKFSYKQKLPKSLWLAVDRVVRALQSHGMIKSAQKLGMKKVEIVFRDIEADMLIKRMANRR